MQILEIREAVEEASDSQALSQIQTQVSFPYIDCVSPQNKKVRFMFSHTVVKRVKFSMTSFFIDLNPSSIYPQIQEKLQHWSESFATAFRSRKYEEARASIRRMTYYKRVNEEIVKKL